jgi:hypothetical protein
VVGEGPASTYTATATILDVTGNPVPDAVVTFAVDPAGPILTPAVCSTNTQGTCAVALHSTVAGTNSVTAAIVAGALTNATTGQPAAVVAWTPDAVCSETEGCTPVDPNLPAERRTRVEVTVNHQVADGAARDVATVWAFDPWGNPVKGALVQSTTTDADLRVQTGIAAIGADGHSTVWYTSTVAGDYRAGVSVDGAKPVGSPVTLTFVPGNPCVVEAGCEPVGPGTDPDRQTRVEVSRDGQPVDGAPNQVTAYAFDQHGNPVAGVVVSFTALDTGLAIDTSCTTAAGGTCVVEATSQTAGSYRAAAAVGGVELTRHGSPVTLAFVAGGVCVVEAGCEPEIPGTPDPGRPDWDRLTHVQVTTNYQPVGGTNVVTVYAFDKYGNPVDGVDFVIEPGTPLLTFAGAGAGANVTVTSSASGTATIGATTSVGGTYPARASVDGVELVDHGSPLGLKFMAVPLITAPGAGDLTNNNPVVIAGTGGEPGHTIQVTDGDQVVCDAVVQPDLTWSCTASLPDGNHVLVATESDDGRNESDPSAPVEIVVDTEAPEVPVITGPTPDKPVNTDKPVITGTGEEPGNPVEIKDGDKVICTAVVQPDLTWSCTPETPLVDGNHSLTAEETDSAGNASGPSKPVEIVVDTEAPNAPVVDPSNGSEITGTTDPDTIVTVTDAGGNPVPGCVDVRPDETGHFACRPDIPLAPGSTITVTATDPAGNESAPVTVTVTGIAMTITYPTRHRLETQVVTGYRFNAGERVCLVTAGREPDCHVADSTGQVVFVFTVPAGVALGEQRVTLRGDTSGEVSATFAVVDSWSAPTGGTIAPAGGTPRGWIVAVVVAAAGIGPGGRAVRRHL